MLRIPVKSATHSVLSNQGVFRATRRSDARFIFTSVIFRHRHLWTSWSRGNIGCRRL